MAFSPAAEVMLPLLPRSSPVVAAVVKPAFWLGSEPLKAPGGSCFVETLPIPLHHDHDPDGSQRGSHLFQYLAGLRKDGREVWMGGERIDDVVDHPLLAGGARGLAGWFDWCHEHAETCLYPSPATGLPVNVSSE